MTKAATETTLRDWRNGQTQAERLCADLLQVEGFTGIDPQSPLGGRDGCKDILCKRDGLTWVVAAHFPQTRQSFPAIKKKFLGDIKGVDRHSADCFVFFTNQGLTPGERDKLKAVAKSVPVEVFHLERIRSILDSPRGYGLRLQYLQIYMTNEEQHSLWATFTNDITVHLLDLHRKFDMVLERTNRPTKTGEFGSSSLLTSAPGLRQFPTADLQIGHLFWIHRLLQEGTGLPRESGGRFRNVNVWIGKPGVPPENARFTPPPPAELPERLRTLVDSWRERYADVSASGHADRILAICRFHHDFLSIHPFLDGNGRVARAVLQQQAFELTGRFIRLTFTDNPVAYFDALSLADNGNLSALVQLVTANLE